MVGDRIYLPTADPIKQSQSVLCLDRSTGKLVWQTEVHSSGADPGKHSNSSAASSTVACDGERLFINFLNQGAVHTTALSLDGKVLWQQKVCNFVTHQGFASSPVLHQSLVLVDDRIYAVNVTGKAFVFEAKPAGFKLLAQNQLGQQAYASPVICGGRIYLRVAEKGEARQEFLYCVGNTERN